MLEQDTYIIAVQAPGTWWSIHTTRYNSYIEAHDAGRETGMEFAVMRVVYNSGQQPDTSLNLQETDNG